MKRHMLQQHQERAKEYLSLPFIEKASYFDSLATSSKGKGVKEKEDCSTKGRFFLSPPREDTQLVNVWLDKSIVEGIIGNLLSRR